MSKTKLIEGPELTPQTLKMATPDIEDFEFITEAYVDCQINGAAAAPEHLPDMIAKDYGMGDIDAPVKALIVAAFLS
jgi:hypothetical protein